jgi:uncharacterized membrane protein
MNVRLKKIWLWTKLVVIILVAVWVTLFFAFNAGTPVKVWLFPGVDSAYHSLDVIIPITAAVTLFMWFIFRGIGKVLSDMNKLHQAEQARDHEKRMSDLARQMEQKLQSPGDNAGPRT